MWEFKVLLHLVRHNQSHLWASGGSLLYGKMKVRGWRQK